MENSTVLDYTVNGGDDFYNQSMLFFSNPRKYLDWYESLSNEDKIRAIEQRGKDEKIFAPYQGDTYEREDNPYDKLSQEDKDRFSDLKSSYDTNKDDPENADFISARIKEHNGE